MVYKKYNLLLFIVSITTIVTLNSCFIKATNYHLKPLKIVVLGSSTAAGTGPENIKNAWVNRYRDYLLNLNSDNKVINLAVGGYTTYHLLPTGTVVSPEKPQPDPEHNITKALTYKPNIIIINLPSNDAAYGYNAIEQINNYTKICQPAYNMNIPVYVTTPQGRNMSKEKLQIQYALKDSTYQIFKDKTIDFWTISASTDGSIKHQYDCGDGVHLNDEGHKLLFEEIIKKVK